jgi:hypothetical protein
MFYAIECWAFKNQHNNKVIARRCGCCVGCVLRLDEIRFRNDNIVEVVGSNYSINIVKNRFRWFGYVEGKHVDYVVR